MRFTFLIVLAHVAAGCTAPNLGLNALRPPSAEVTHVTILEQTDQGAQVEIAVELRNPNNVALPLVAIRYSVALEQIAPFALHD